MSDVLLELESRPGDPKSKRLRMTTADVTIGADQFRWGHVDRVNYAATVQIINGADMGAIFTIRLGNSSRTSVFALTSGTTGVVRIDRQHDLRRQHQEQWAAAVTILEHMVSNRLVDQAIAALGRGETVTIGGLELDQRGIHKRGLFAKAVAWRDVSTTTVFNGSFHIWREGARKPAVKAPNGAWNVVLLPRIIELLASR